MSETTPALSRFTKMYHSKPYDSISPTRPELSVNGKVIMITGGGKGIGKAIAVAFAQANAKVIVITGRTEAALKETSSEIEKLGCKSVYYVADVTNKNIMQRIFSTVEADFESLDVVVSNAAYLHDLAPLKDIDVEEWWSAFEVNVRGSFIATQAFLHIARPGATLISISSAISHTSGIVGFPYQPDMTGYSASKLAGVKVMEDVQAEHPELRIFSLHPGLVESDMNRKSKIAPQDSVELPAAVCVWLASPEADFLKGRMMWANWDVDELKQKRQEIEEKYWLKSSLSGWQ